MADFKKKLSVSLLQKSIYIVAVLLFMTPSAADAESLLLLHKEGGSPLVAEAVRQTVKRPVDICLNENGDLVIRRSDVLLTLAHTPPDEIIERLQITQRQDCRSISDISLKISFLF
ncbi:MAG: hypothetical protein PHP95_16045 [Desulfuromonadaceae bacterium]|nr:hypothetical protein [Desulfuromonadaceae bacterium]MDD2849964.1 hypothetical protein [Desulfuromonadaceae bacterium]MDD4131205.1 hypothetical protein [Desulfuromonadaceae bacterium]